MLLLVFLSTISHSSSSLWQIQKSSGSWQTLNLDLSSWLEDSWQHPENEREKISMDDTAEVGGVIFSWENCVWVWQWKFTLHKSIRSGDFSILQHSLTPKAWFLVLIAQTAIYTRRYSELKRCVSWPRQVFTEQSSSKLSPNPQNPLFP